MTGAGTFRRSELLVAKGEFTDWLDSLKGVFRLIGPVGEDGLASFSEAPSSASFSMGYKSTMLPPGKLFIYKPVLDLFRFESVSKGAPKVIETLPVAEKQVIVGIHPCDTHAITYLDRVFLGQWEDPYYSKIRENTLIISLNCSFVSENCFCRSMGTGPFFKAESGTDIVLTDFEDRWLIEIKSPRAGELFKAAGIGASEEDIARKSEMEKTLIEGFKKSVETKGLETLLREGAAHPLWERISEERCLSCSNCVMVCPTCFCYDVSEETGIDLKDSTRLRRWDSCQDMAFSEVHGGNFRQRRAGRLRQFVTHKLGHARQFGSALTVGCGRCITWCPTGIDLVEIAKEIKGA